MASNSHLNARIGLILFVGAVAPYACRAVGNVLLTLFLKCCCGLTRDQFKTAMIGKGRLKQLSIIYIRSGRVSWNRARKISNLSQRSAIFVSAVRLIFWHWLQPLSYAFVFYAYWDLLDRVEIVLGLAVAFREFVYFVLTIICLYVNPAFLMVSLRATYQLYSWWYVVQYVVSPVKYVCSTLIRTWKPPEESSVQDDDRSIYTFQYGKAKQHHTCCSEGYGYHDMAMAVLVLLDLPGMVALLWTFVTGHVYVALMVGYAVTFLDGTFQIIYFTVAYCTRSKYNLCNFYEPIIRVEESLSDPQGGDPIEMKKLGQWLDGIGMKQYQFLFVEEGFGDRFQDILHLKEEDLKELGVAKLAHRKRLSAEIQKLGDADDSLYL